MIARERKFSFIVINEQLTENRGLKGNGRNENHGN